MFGYVVVNKSELKFKEFDQYRRYYCGLCRRLRKQHGRKGQIALSYDMTFLVLLLTGLYEPEGQGERKRCIVHPWKKQELLYNACTEYVADMTVLLTYYKCIDDFEDEKKWFQKLYANGLGRTVELLKQKYPEKIEKIQEAMKHFSLIEAEMAEKLSGKREGFEAVGKETGGNFSGGEEYADIACLDTLSDAFGQVLSQIFSFSLWEKEKIWLASLEKIGYEIGRFIYIVDAYDDLEQDGKRGCFNPLFFSEMKGEALNSWIEDVLRGIIASAAREFEKLPILEDVGILRNILYSGIWTRFYQVREARRNKQEKQQARQEKQQGKQKRQE